MKKLILIGLTLLPTLVIASPTPPCKAKAVRAAMSSYLSMGTIQGDSPLPSYKFISVKDGVVKHLVIINGGNEDGETWDIPYKVETDLNNNCKVLSVKKGKTL